MTSNEKRLLHRIYYLTEMVDSELLFKASELYWVLHASKSDSRSWRGVDGRLKKLEEGSSDWLASMVNTSHSVDKALSYLQSKGFISSKKENDMYRITVTGEGAEIARKLNSFWGEVDVLYKDHKDGALWFLATIAVAMITALITNLME